MSPRSVRLLHPENQEYLNEHRWPPVWYVIYRMQDFKLEIDSLYIYRNN